MENFEETVVNPNIRLKDYEEQLQPLSNQSSEQQGPLNDQAPGKKNINSYFLFIVSIVVAIMVALFVRG